MVWGELNQWGGGGRDGINRKDPDFNYSQEFGTQKDGDWVPQI